ncbi:hypothetical protein F441_10669 [Phytophthora nicotianae CJ01A1]|uniref:RxLR effector protein n=6 Tax=Phytophthora nicotianae TaxID=4792 RepID=W2Q4U7_PHYN3|nr:hypothetical protein PPTG_12421 [Phytophthora nicotianae INRA-310]ETI44578.1 hypothetical protein F443_10734 [Phytophthora nicotianae P1569]ETK84567.1 hypothetical protein L915_10487 [Phytophthora nicotianae]ETO73223.1 hypothetical protein F444_10824 [Phytophthora nicotianae P1976]ETP14399.1 hypothetical protein F441_10669 [Phytophthora nicotianae CJ01A1]ETP42463.1 hypothetical protein F442_10633 [Phytophthora nicotianae P10297]KUF86523.1 hypothetical protein AM587_10000632 [Phytophthora n
MRLTWILAMVLAATLQANSIALPAAKGTNAMFENVPSPDVADSVRAGGGRLLTRIEKPASNEDAIEEERFFSRFMRWYKHRASLRAESKHAKWLAEKSKEIIGK